MVVSSLCRLCDWWRLWHSSTCPDTFVSSTRGDGATSGGQIGRPSHLKIPDGPKLARAALSRLAVDMVSVAVLGFCVWGNNGAGIFVRGANGGLSTKGAKLLLPKA